MNLMLLLEMASSAFGDRVAVRCEDESLSYSELFAAAGRAANLFEESGTRHAALLDVSSLAVPVGLFGSAWAGVPYVPLNYRLSGAELGALLDRITPAMLVTSPGRDTPVPDGTTSIDRLRFLERVRTGPTRESSWSMEGDDVAILLFTSGTTGAPKAAVLRQRHMVSYILGSVEFGSASEDEATLVSVPPYHVAGMAAVLSSVYAGRRVVQLPAFDPRRWLEVARNERVSHAFVVPTMLARIVNVLETEAHSSAPPLRAISYGGGKMPASVIDKAMQLFPKTDFTNAYGLTETSSTITILGPEDHRRAAASNEPAVRRRLTSVGRAFAGVELEVRDGNGRRLPPGESGEIHVRGAQVSGEYLGHGALLDGEGWFATKDAGFLDEEGYLYVEGRLDDVIVRGGENMSPGEIEEVLLEHDSVADAAVVGIPDEEWGEVVAAVIVTKPGRGVESEELRQWVRERLRSSRMPQRVDFRDTLPYNEMGKLMRRQLRAELQGT